MNKIVSVPVMDSRNAGKANALGHKPIADLREWLARVEEIGELTPGKSAGGPRRGDECDFLSGRQAAAFTGGSIRAAARF